MTTGPALVSVNVGMPKDVSWQGKTVYTGVWKQPVDGPAMVRRLNIDGDGQGDTNGHGGEQRAVLDHRLAGLQPQPGAVEVYLGLVRLERDEAGDASHLGPGVEVGPGRPAGVPDVVVVARALVRAERLPLDGGER